MKKLKLNLSGAKELNRAQQRSINGGSGETQDCQTQYGCNSVRRQRQFKNGCACKYNNDCCSNKCEKSIFDIYAFCKVA